jgi:hypothetical protein
MASRDAPLPARGCVADVIEGYLRMESMALWGGVLWRGVLVRESESAALDDLRRRRAHVLPSEFRRSRWNARVTSGGRTTKQQLAETHNKFALLLEGQRNKSVCFW